MYARFTESPMSPQSTASANDPAASAHISSSSLLGPTIKAWRFFLEDQGVSPHTVKAFSSDMHLLASYLPPDRPVGDISTSDLNLFLDWLQGGRGVACSPKSLARRITSIKAFFRWLHQYGALLIDPAEKVPQRSVISPLPVVLTEPETQVILDTAGKHRLAAKPDARPLALVELLLDHRDQERRMPGAQPEPPGAGSAGRRHPIRALRQPAKPLQGTQDRPDRIAGSRSTTNTPPNTTSKTGCSPGRSAAWNICWKT